MVSALAWKSIGLVRALVGLSCCVFGQDTHTVLLSTETYQWVPSNLMLGWGVSLPSTSIQYRRKGKYTTSRLMSQKKE